MAAVANQPPDMHGHQKDFKSARLPRLVIEVDRQQTGATPILLLNDEGWSRATVFSIASSQTITLPNFLVIGAGRSGTTSLHHYLMQHPDVFVPSAKAPSFFYAVDESPDRRATRDLATQRSFVRDWDSYVRLFDAWSGQRAVGEVSPAYLMATGVASRIADRLPEVRLIAVLRDPLQRAHARYVARRRDGLERARTFEQVVADEMARPFDLNDTAGTYVAGGFVSHVIETYLDRFPPERIRFFLHDDLKYDTSSVVTDLWSFLEVDPRSPAPHDVHNRSGGVISQPLVRAAWTRSASIRQRIGPLVPKTWRDRAFRLATRQLAPLEMNATVRARLADLYEPEVTRLGQLIKRDLSHWCAREDS